MQYWRDQSGHGYDLSQATAGYRPTFRTPVRRSLPVVRFDGAGDHMLASGVPAIDLRECTLVLVLGEAAGLSSQVGIAVIGASGSGASYNAATRIGIQSGGVTAKALQVVGGTGGEAVSTLPHLHTTLGFGVRSFRVHRRWIQAFAHDMFAAPADESTTLTTSQSGFLLGSWYDSTPQLSGSYAGDIAEVVLFARPLTDTQLGQVVTALMGKWGV